jgi:hypothetical protein
MMLLVDYIEVLTKGAIGRLLKGRYRFQYFLTSFLGVLPGCGGSFINVSAYIHGLLTLGALLGGMIASVGDEAFVMLGMFPGKAIFLFGILFLLGIIFGSLGNKIASFLKVPLTPKCPLSPLPVLKSVPAVPGRKVFLTRLLFLTILAIFTLFIFFENTQPHSLEKIILAVFLGLAIFIIVIAPDHYIKRHLVHHILRHHLWRVFLWSLAALFIIKTALWFWDLEAFIRARLFWVLLSACGVGLFPISGPQMIFVVMFSERVIPFSILLANAIVQDGHGMLPLLSYSLREALFIKLFKLALALSLGSLLWYLGW